MMTSDQQRVKSVRFINDESVQLDLVYNDDFIEASAKTNVIIAAFKTAQARLKLYIYLKCLGERALYCDTDSIVIMRTPYLNLTKKATLLYVKCEVKTQF